MSLLRVKGSYSTLVTGPATPILSTQDAKDQCRVDGSDEDSLLDAKVAAATDMLDAKFGELGLALITQTWRLTMPSFATDFDLPMSPVQSVSSIKYFDADDVEQTLVTSAYRFTAIDDRGRISLRSGQSWPAVFNRPDAISVDYVAGFGDASADVPPGILEAARLLTAHFYEHREAVSDGMEELPVGVRHLLHKYRVARGFF